MVVFAGLQLAEPAAAFVEADNGHGENDHNAKKRGGGPDCGCNGGHGKCSPLQLAEPAAALEEANDGYGEDNHNAEKRGGGPECGGDFGHGIFFPNRADAQCWLLFKCLYARQPYTQIIATKNGAKARMKRRSIRTAAKVPTTEPFSHPPTTAHMRG